MAEVITFANILFPLLYYYIMQCFLNNDATTVFERTDKLYHFTNFEAACKILASKTLKLSQMNRMNDVNESFRSIYSKSEGMYFSWSTSGAKYSQLSFSEDTGKMSGFLNLPMWGYYADKGRGVCIVLDKNKVIEELQTRKFWHGKVRYIKRHHNDLIISSEKEIDRRYRSVFFRKNNAWKHENEYRVVSRDPSLRELNIRESIRWVIMYHLGEEPICDTAEYKTLLKILDSEDQLLVYGRFLNEEILSSYVDNDTKIHWKHVF